jgi:hypothetical protein
MSLIVLLSVVAACATTSSTSPDPNLLAFLDRGPVLRADVTRHLGAPSAVFEAGHALTYRLSASKAGYSPAPQSEGWDGVNYDLVLVFDADGELTQHALVAIRPTTDR